MMTPSFWGVFSQFKRNGATQSSYIFVSGQNGHHNITDILRIKSWIMQILNSRIIYYTILLCQIHIVTCTQSHTQSRTNIVTRTMTRIQSHTQATTPPPPTHTHIRKGTYIRSEIYIRTQAPVLQTVCELSKQPVTQVMDCLPCSSAALQHF